MTDDSHDVALVAAALAALSQLATALRAVEALHLPTHGYCVVCDGDRDVEALGNNPACEHHASFCRGCDLGWPCPTFRALEAAA